MGAPKKKGWGTNSNSDVCDDDADISDDDADEEDTKSDFTTISA